MQWVDGIQPQHSHSLPHGHSRDTSELDATQPRLATRCLDHRWQLWWNHKPIPFPNRCLQIGIPRLQSTCFDDCLPGTPFWSGWRHDFHWGSWKPKKPNRHIMDAQQANGNINPGPSASIHRGTDGLISDNCYIRIRSFPSERGLCWLLPLFQSFGRLPSLKAHVSLPLPANKVPFIIKGCSDGKP